MRTNEHTTPETTPERDGRVVAAKVEVRPHSLDARGFDSVQDNLVFQQPKSVPRAGLGSAESICGSEKKYASTLLSHATCQAGLRPKTRTASATGKGR